MDDLLAEFESEIQEVQQSLPPPASAASDSSSSSDAAVVPPALPSVGRRPVSSPPPLPQLKPAFTSTPSASAKPVLYANTDDANNGSSARQEKKRRLNTISAAAVPSISTTSTTVRKKKAALAPLQEDIDAARRAVVAQATTYEMAAVTGSSADSSGKKLKPAVTMRFAGGQVWEDKSLAEWPENDYRLFAGDLGNDVNDNTLAKLFQQYASFAKAKVIRDKKTQKTKGFGFVSFLDPFDCISALKEKNGAFLGNRPIKLRKSTWNDRQLQPKKGSNKTKRRRKNHLY